MRALPVAEAPPDEQGTGVAVAVRVLREAAHSRIPRARSCQGRSPEQPVLGGDLVSEPREDEPMRRSALGADPAASKAAQSLSRLQVVAVSIAVHVWRNPRSS